jgi:hypothetical protein
MKYLSKSNFKVAQTCPTKLYYKKNKYPSLNEENDYLSLLADGGFMIGKLAQLLYPEGIEIEGNVSDSIRLTEEAIQAHENITLFEPAIFVNNQLVRVDVFIKRGKSIDVIEVKSKSYNSEALANSKQPTKSGKLKNYWLEGEFKPYLEDIAYQKKVVQEKFPDCSVNAYLMMPDKSRINEHEDIIRWFILNKKGSQTTIDFVGNETDLEALRASNVAIINSSPTIPAQMKANLSRAALSGLFDQNPEEIYKIAYGNDEIVTFGGVAYNASAARRGESNTWLTAPKAPTNLAETILSDLDPAKFTPESIAQALTLFNQATTPVDQNTALSVLQLQSSSDPSNSVKILSSDLAMDVTAYNSWVRGGKQGEPDFWIKAPTAAETGTDAFSAIIEDLPWGNYTPESISTWLAAQDAAVTSLEKADTIRLLQPARSGTSTAALTPAILQAEEAATTSSSQAGRMLSLSTQFDTAMGSGSSARMGALWRTFTGNSSDADAMRLELRAIQNTFVLANLPSGSSSDADVALARSTTPDEFNDPELINSWLRGQAKMAAMAAEYNLFKADYLNKNQNPAGLSRAWEEQRNAPGYRENIESKYGFKFNPDADREATRAAATQGRN